MENKATRMFPQLPTDHYLKPILIVNGMQQSPRKPRFF